MKMPKAVQLPSGSWRVSVMVQGRRVSVTAATKRQAEQDAAAIKIGAKSVPSTAIASSVNQSSRI